MNEEQNSNTNEDIVLDQYSYKTLHKLIKSGMWKMYCSREFKIVGVEWSDELRRMIGYTNEQDFPNRFEAWSDLLHPDDKDRVLREIDPVLQDVTGNKIFDQDYRLYTKDQGYRWFRASADVARREDGTPYCLFGIFVDITEQKEHAKLEKARDEALKKADAELVWRDTLADIMTRNLDSVYVILNKKNRESVYVSPSIEPILGISKETPHPLLAIQKLEQDTNNDYTIEEIIELEAGCSIVRDCFIRPVGSNVVKMFQKTLYHVVREKEDLLIFELTDHTHEQEIRNNIEDALEIAKSANAAKSTFLSNMSHDIRTPMNVIIGLSNLMEHEIDHPEKMKEYIQKIQMSSKHLLGLINDILDMSKIESGGVTLHNERFHLMEQIREIDMLIWPQALQKEQQFEICRENIIHENLEGDALRFRQVFINILENAVKYTGRSGRIRFTISEMESKSESCAKYKFSVEDNGIGIKQEYLSKIFEPFSRQEHSVTNAIQGTGLGMAITKNIVDMMGGVIRVESIEGEGSTFEVILELRVAKDEKEKAQTEYLKENKEEQEDILQGMHFLCAEDNELNAEILTAMLEMSGAQCKVCPNGKEVVEEFERAEQNEYDMILMDVQMPVMNGYEAAQRIRVSTKKEGRDIPILAMTANAFADDIQRSFDAGMDAHISKPMDLELLKQTIWKIKRAKI